MPPIDSINALPKPFQGKWEGESKIVIGIDIGSTQSGVAFAFLQQGVDQEVHRVTHWPGQEAASLQGKIPTVVWYDPNGKAVSFGAEAMTHQAEDDAEDNNWQLAKHFKLHLHPSDLKAKYNLELDPLPNGVSLRQIYSDFLGYLLKHTQSFFVDRIIDGRMIWETYQPRMEVVIAHPNGWGLREQTFLRAAAVDAHLASAVTAQSKIRFVTEAEASVHFCIYHTNLGSRIQAGTKFVVCDAGGSTVDTTVYSVTAARPVLKIQEARSSACVQSGAIFVDAAAEKYLHNVLTNASLNRDDVKDYTARGVKDFESVAKRSFRDQTEEKTVEIASTRFNNSYVRIRRGRMTLSGSTVKSFFDACTRDIMESVDQQIDGTGASYLLLVGGFGDSPYLRQEFRNRYEPQGCQVTLTNDSTSKAVADGAVIWNVVTSVIGRAPRLSFGVTVSQPYQPGSSECAGREVYISPSGEERVRGGWSQIVAKGIVIDANAINRRTFGLQFETGYPDLEDFEVLLLSYSNLGEPKWAKDKHGALNRGFQKSCSITADLAGLSGALERRIGVHGNMYWHLVFDICIRFGGTELEAYLEWEEEGETRTGDVTIVPGEPFEL